MSTLWATLAALLGLLSVAMAQNMSTISMSPSITPTPTPNPQPEESFYLHTERNGSTVVCAHVEASFTFYIDYYVEKKVKTVELNMNSTFVPHVDQAESQCGKSSILLVIAFNTSEADHSFSLTFTNSSKEYTLKSFNATFDFSDNTTFPDFDTNATGTYDFGYGKDVFTVDYKKSYKCNTKKSYDLKPLEEVPGLKSVYLRTRDFKAQAFKFKNETSGDFDSSVTCSLDQKSSKVVPIAVGAALAGLVVVVLIAYLIGRFRSRKQNSYEALS